MRVRAFCENIDDVVATVMAATIKSKYRKNDLVKLVCHHLRSLCLHDGQLGLELHHTTAKTFLRFVSLSTIDR